MLTIRSITETDTRYFFESLGFVTPEHMKKGLYVGVSCNLEHTLLVSAPVPVAESESSTLRKIIQDCAHPEVRAAYDVGPEVFFKYLNACGIFEAPYRIHTVRVQP